jgi:hypothetical protein
MVIDSLLALLTRPMRKIIIHLILQAPAVFSLLVKRWPLKPSHQTPESRLDRNVCQEIGARFTSVSNLWLLAMPTVPHCWVLVLRP